MPMKRVVAVLALSLPVVAGCGPEPGSAPTATQPRFITYGQTDASNTYSNVGAMIVRSRATGQIYPVCTGTMISSTVFLSAAHCTAYYEQELAADYELFVSFANPVPWGDLTDTNTPLVPVAQVVTNPGYNHTASDPGDIAVLIVPARSTRGITPATLPTAGLLDRLAASGVLRASTFTAVGYGIQDRIVGGGTPYNVDANPVPRMFAFSSLNSLTPAFLRLSQNPATGNGGTCYGDSGGPNFMPVNGRQVLVATTITGDAVCRSTNVDYRLDTPAARTFLAPYVALP